MRLIHPCRIVSDMFVCKQIAFYYIFLPLSQDDELRGHTDKFAHTVGNEALSNGF